MRELSPKFANFTILAFILMMTACVMDPVDLVQFLDDEKVIEIIESSKGTIILATGSEGNPGSRKVTGLTAGKYYLIEKQNADMSFSLHGFAKSNGTLSLLVDIGKLTGTEISSLENDVTYMVKSAAAATGNISYSWSSGLYNDTAPTNAGVITITADSGVTEYTIKFPSEYEDQQKVKVSSPANSLIPTSDDSINLDVNTKTDIVFYDSINGTLAFLGVVIQTRPALNINLTPYTPPPQVSIPDITIGSVAISDIENSKNSADYTRTINIANPAGMSEITWKYGNTTLNSSVAGITINTYNSVAGAQLIINFKGDGVTDMGMNCIGEHVYTVTAKSGGITWSAIFAITVTAVP